MRRIYLLFISAYFFSDIATSYENKTNTVNLIVSGIIVIIARFHDSHTNVLVCKNKP